MLGLMGKTCLFLNIVVFICKMGFVVSTFVHELVRADPRNVLLFG
jgi:hypothetical protein